MPSIDLNGSPNDIGWIQAVMAFPNDRELREQYFAVHVARAYSGDSDHRYWFYSITRYS